MGANEQVSGAILAGGRGSRMGGADKGWIEFHGRPLVEHVLERFAPQVDELLISANRNLDRYRALGHTVLEDRFPGFAGPLAGLHAALCAARFDLVATVPCDSPLLPIELVERLHEALRASGADVAVARAGNRLHPVFALCRKHRAADLAEYLAGGGRRYREWIERQAHASVAFEDASAFANVNLADDLARLDAASR